MYRFSKWVQEGSIKSLPLYKIPYAKSIQIKNNYEKRKTK